MHRYLYRPEDFTHTKLLRTLVFIIIHYFVDPYCHVQFWFGYYDPIFTSIKIYNRWTNSLSFYLSVSLFIQ